MKPKEFTEALEVELTDEEVAEYSKKLSGSVIEHEKLKGEARRVARHYASRLDLLAKEQQDYAVKVEERKEIRQVECEERPQYDLGVIWIVRLDTFDKVRERPMTAQDRQARMFEDETGGLRNEFLEDRGAAVEEERQQAEQAADSEEAERERLHKEAVANWRREKPWEKGTFCACGHVHVALGCSDDDCGCEEFREPEEEGMGFDPGFPPGFDPDRASAGLAQVGEDEDGADWQAEWLAGLTGEERQKYYAAPCLCGHYREWHSEEDRDTSDKPCALCSCSLYHCAVCDTKGGHRATCEHYVLGEGTPVQKADDFTAPRCASCGRIDGAHAPECVWSDALRFDDYLAYARAHYKSNHQSHARKMELSKLKDEEVRAWKQQQAGNGVEAEPEPEKKPKRAKFSPVEAAIDR